MAMNLDYLGAEILAEIPRDLEDFPETPTDRQSIVRAAVEEAIQWREEHLEPEQTKATDYYLRKPFGNERAGRSQVVTATVSDVVGALMPSLLRIFFGPENIVEFKPRRPDAQAMADQQTDYVNLLIREDNRGFETFYATMKDALIRKVGAVHYWWQEEERVEGSVHSGLTQEEVDLLAEEEGVTLEVVLTQEAVTTIDPVTQMEVVVEPALFDVEAKRTYTEGCVKIAAIPSEELISSPSARSRDEARMIGRVREVPADELVLMGVPLEVVERFKGRSRSLGLGNDLEASRSIDHGARDMFEDEQDPATRPVQFADIYILLESEDEEGTAELRHIQAIGDEYLIITDEPADDRPFALFCPDPEPHTLVGRSTADKVMDLQLISSAITRGMLDSLSQTLNPSTEVVESQVNMKDVLNPEVGRILRVKQPGMIREVASSFVGKEALPVLQWLDELKENRTGISKAAAGLDADALQSSTKAAVAATLSAAQQQIEVVARIFAETGYKDLFRGLMKLVVRHQNKPRIVRLRGEFVEIDPRHWDADLDVVVNIALGAGMTEEKLQALSMIAAKQEQMLQMGVPLTGFAEYRKTLGRMIELAGFPNSNEFFRPWTAEQDAAMEQAKAQQPPQKSEAEMLVEVEMAKIQSQMQMKQMELQVKAEELRLLDERERYKITSEIALKREAIERKYITDVSDQEIQKEKLALDATKSGIDAGIKLSEVVNTAEEPNVDLTEDTRI